MLKLDMAVPDHLLTRRAPGGERLLAGEIQGQDWGAAKSSFAPEVASHAGRPVLALRAGRNGGFSLSGVATATFSAGVIWASPEGEARTLLALRKGRDKSYLYLSEAADRTVTLRENSGRLLLVLPPSDREWQAVLFGRSNGRVSLRRVGGPVIGTDVDPEIPREASLLIGCRAMRQGLAGSLGSARIAEVMLWRDADVTGDDAAVADYVDWEY